MLLRLCVLDLPRNRLIKCDICSVLRCYFYLITLGLAFVRFSLSFSSSRIFSVFLLLKIGLLSYSFPLGCCITAKCACIRLVL